MFNLDLETILLRTPAIILGLTVHEFSHGFIAYLLGDKTAKRDGRMSFNPLRHIDPLGIILLLLVGFGWAKPVMVNPRNFKEPKFGMAITSLAGPVSNLLLAFIGMLIYYPLAFSSFNGTAFGYLMDFIWIFIYMNISLGIFNMLPIPPLDGSKFFAFFLPDDAYFKFTGFRYGFILLVILIYSGLSSNILQPLMTGIMNLYISAAGKIFSF